MENYGTLKNLFEILKEDTMVDLFNKYTNLWYFSTVGFFKEKFSDFDNDFEVLNIKIGHKGIDITISADIELC